MPRQFLQFSTIAMRHNRKKTKKKSSLNQQQSGNNEPATDECEQKYTMYTKQRTKILNYDGKKNENKRSLY